jgi:hypothetical protein
VYHSLLVSMNIHIPNLTLCLCNVAASLPFHDIIATEPTIHFQSLQCSITCALCAPSHHEYLEKWALGRTSMPLTVPIQEVDVAVPLSRCRRNKHSPAIATLDARLSSPFRPASPLPETFSRSLSGLKGGLTLDFKGHVFAGLVPIFPNRNVLGLLCSREQTPMGFCFHSAQIITNQPPPFPPFRTFAFHAVSAPAPPAP